MNKTLDTATTTKDFLVIAIWRLVSVIALIIVISIPFGFIGPILDPDWGGRHTLICAMILPATLIAFHFLYKQYCIPLRFHQKLIYPITKELSSLLRERPGEFRSGGVPWRQRFDILDLCDLHEELALVVECECYNPPKSIIPPSTEIDYRPFFKPDTVVYDCQKGAWTASLNKDFREDAFFEPLSKGLLDQKLKQLGTDGWTIITVSGLSK